LRALLKAIAMNYINITGELREAGGKKAAKAVRNAERIPACIYGKENIQFATTLKDVRHLIYTPEFKLARIDINGQTHDCFVKDVQYHPVSEAIVHIDFQELIPGRALKVDIPVVLRGVSVGVKAGGKMLQMVRRIRIKTTPESLVDHLEADITHMELGQALRVKEVKLPAGVELLIAPSIPVCQVEIPRALRSAAAAAEKAK
jgi:large subunit ribosomal protein L25